jgi:hypothetical protein
MQELVITQMAKSDPWKATLTKNGCLDLFLAGGDSTLMSRPSRNVLKTLSSLRLVKN